ncbi:MAG: uroporphyrinogen-III C-methyltransferase [Planctomycetota bacterium]
MTINKGVVYLVGAGPGAPELLTLGARHVIEQADIILYDGLVNEAILDFAPLECQKICVGKRGNRGAWIQSQIDDLIVRSAREHQRVVRLKGGDTAVFARTSEEIARLEAEGIPYEVIPGLTAALALSAYTGIPLTHRDWSSGVALVAAQLQNHDGESDAEDQLDWEALARFPGTLVLYMSISAASIWSQKLIAAGKPSSTPVAIVRQCSMPDQEVLECELGTVARTLEANPHFKAPAVSIIGALVRFKSPSSLRTPMRVPAVIVTSPQAQAQRLSQMLQTCGVSVLVRPALEIRPGSPEEIDQAIDTLHETDWIVFSSRYGVEFFFKRLSDRGFDSRRLHGVRIATVGRSTAQALEEKGLKADWVAGIDSNNPREAMGADALLEEWSEQARNKRITLVQTPEGKATLRQRLTGIASLVRTVNAYEQIPTQSWHDIDSIKSRIEASDRQSGKIAVTATSGNIAKSAWQLLGSHAMLVRWIAISPGVAQVLNQLGATDVIVSQEASYESLCRAISSQ